MVANTLLLITAAIWGLGFVAQVLGMNYLEPFAFIGIRFLLGALSLVPLVMFFHYRNWLPASSTRIVITVGGLGVIFTAGSLQEVTSCIPMHLTRALLPVYTWSLCRLLGWR